jgi:MYXO-CTERM domain-containing protein
MRHSVAVLAGLVLLTLAPVARAHTVLASPPARDLGQVGADAHKSGVCGGVARTGRYTQYAVGATVNVDFTETVDHRGCFQVLFSEANDTNFTILKQVDDPSGDVTPKKHTVSVQLPAGKSCQNCTLSVRQLMINKACVANQPSLAAGDTYFTCADICVGTNCPPMVDAGAPDSSADSGPATDSGGPTPTASGTPTPTPTGTGTTPTPTPTGTSTAQPQTLEPADDQGGCASAPGGQGSLAGLFLVGVAGVVVGARRRRRS